MERPTECSFIVLAAVLTVPLSIFSSPRGTPYQVTHDKRLSFVVRNETALSALIKLASSNGFPLGLAFGYPGAKTLCEPAKDGVFVDRKLGVIVSAILDNSKYKWDISRNTVHVFRDPLEPALDRVLKETIPKFGFQSATTMQSLGGELTGYSHTILYPGEGYAGDSLANPEQLEVKPFSVENIPMETLLDKVVSMGGKGLWFAAPKRTTISGKSRVEVQLNILSYTYDHSNLDELPECSEVSP